MKLIVWYYARLIMIFLTVSGIIWAAALTAQSAHGWAAQGKTVSFTDQDANRLALNTLIGAVAVGLVIQLIDSLDFDRDDWWFWGVFILCGGWSVVAFLLQLELAWMPDDVFKWASTHLNSIETFRQTMFGGTSLRTQLAQAVYLLLPVAGGVVIYAFVMRQIDYDEMREHVTKVGMVAS